MRTLVNCIIAVAAGAAIGCSSQDRHSTISTDAAGGASAGSPTRTTIVGCLEAGDRAGTFRLRALSDTTDRQGANSPVSGTSGSTGQPQRPANSTTGLGGDAIRNAPTIGAGAVYRTYELVLSDANTGNLDRNVGAEVSVVGVIEDNATAARDDEKPRTDAQAIRASSITKIADRCSASR